MHDPLIRELTNHEHFRAQLMEQFPDADEETLRDTLEGLSNLQDMVVVVIRTQQEDRVLSRALRARIEEMQERLRRLDHRVERKRTLVAMVMERAQIDKIVEPDFTASLRHAPPPLVISDDTSIPADYWKPQPAKLDRKKLLDALKGGKQIAGACLGNGGQTVSVRVK